mmetsp:Transcript_77714/g.155630  ORF Transcript_77714/g.155630 Transcript_77714/m.155630 type:complete len:443 (+) Transcript_77714:119-1447(+)
MPRSSTVLVLFSLLGLWTNWSADGFISGRPGILATSPFLQGKTHVAPGPPSMWLASALSAADTETDAAADTADDDLMAIRSPLRYIGPYPALALNFPNLATPAQRARGASGVTLDFVVDTAANVNTINAAVANELGLAAVGRAPGGVGASGALASGGTTFMLGDAQLADVSTSERITFMGGLTASALPVASPSAAGLLGIAFLFSFPGGFEMRWGNQTATAASAAYHAEQQQETVTPSITFFGDLVGTDRVTRGLAQVPARQLESGLVVVTLCVNGVEVPALLDTGSPVTVLNAAAAKLVGLAAPPSAAAAASASAKDAEEAAAAARSRNPLARFAASVQANVQAAQAAQMAAQSAASNGEVLTLGGAGGARIELRRLAAAHSVVLGGVELGSDDLRCYVGDLPGLAALGGLGAAAGPAAVLGTDILRRRPRLVLQDGKVYL